MRIHILYHARKEPFFGLWMKEELESHGYEISAGTLYPILHNLEKDKVITSTEKVVDGKVRKYYTITPKGEQVLKDVKNKTAELFQEIFENDGDLNV